MPNEEPKTTNDLALDRTHLADHRTDLAGQRTDLAVDRTLMAANRTLMAWVRTAISLISFGFTIHKLLQNTVGETQVGLLKMQGGRRLGLFLIGLGTMCVIMGTIEYFETSKRLDKNFVISFKKPNMSLVMGGAIGFLGLFLLITMLTHTEVF